MADTVLLDPKQASCVEYYKDPTSPTFGDFKNSLIRAGFSVAYAGNHYNKDIEWIKQAKQSVQSIEQAESNLSRINHKDIDLDDLKKTDIELLKIQTNVSMFILKTLAKSKYDPDEKKSDTNVQVNIIRQNKNAPIEVEDIEVTTKTE